MYLFILTSILILPLRGSSSASVPTRLLVTRVGPCYDAEEGVVTVSEMKLEMKPYDSTLSGILNITEDVENGWIVKARMQKCHDIRNQDTCDHYKSFPLIRSGCSEDYEDADEGDLVTMFLHYVHPANATTSATDTCDYYKSFPLIRRSAAGALYEDTDDGDLVTMFLHYVHLECPLKAGSYKIKDYPFFSDNTDFTAVESKISTSVFGYSFRLEAFDADEDVRLMCVDAYLRMLYVRKHNWLTGDMREKATTTPEPEIKQWDDEE